MEDGSVTAAAALTQSLVRPRMLRGWRGIAEWREEKK